ncbi:metal-dependent hydrolase [Sansalvadorimonas verongulae]|uniref:metal-dependent hydrolase n=1 Tax=Sansalvadorimonas verongulae TaxID=2172824 RepID=UPI0012BD2D54|nr:metal-dependent hydrolase [Sansalvadorimonas verongulae]MTI14323.1 metal-dependent hydrolase [Sansalvadorimonas verongulae]
MAQFKTHLIVAAAVTGSLSVTTLYAGLVSPATALSLWILGTLGGLLPDIDSKSSLTLRLFNLLFMGGSAAFVVARLGRQYPLLWTLGAVVGTLAALALVVIPLFKKNMVHRGNCHSLLAALFTAVIASITSLEFLETSIQTAYLAGLFAGGGFITHLLLDEIYALKFKDEVGLKKSFGTAMKLFSKRAPISSAVMAVLCGLGFWWMPEPDSLTIVLQKLAHASMHAMG